MSQTVPIMMFGWPLVVVALFGVLRPRHAVIAAFLFAWLFLPMAGYSIASGIPDYTKTSATCYGVLLGVMLFDAGRVTRFRFSWIDIPIAVLFVTPMASSVANGLGVWDGGNWMSVQLVDWVIPYFIGRLYFSDLEGLRDLAIGVFIGGLIYMPFCLFEMEMSPRLHKIVYGFHQHSFRQHFRFGGYRPKVFMQHGLAVAMWMAVASVVGLWLWRSGALRKLYNVPMSLLVPALMGTAVFCRSLGAIALMVMGIATLLVTKWTGLRAFVLVLILLPAVYMGVRGTGVWDGSHLTEAAAVVAEERAGSIRYRLEAEDLLAEHAWRQPVLGWGRWGRNRPARMGYDEVNLATDGLWIIMFGQQGLVGLLAMTTVVLLPPFLLWRRLRGMDYSHPRFAPAAALGVMLVLFMIDSLLNAMLNPVYLLAAGGLSGLVVASPVGHRQVARKGATRLGLRRRMPSISATQRTTL